MFFSYVRRQRLQWNMTSTMTNGTQVGETKVDYKTRRPEWKEHFLIRSDLAEPDPPPEDDDASNADDDEPYNATSAGTETTCIAATEQRQSGASYWVGAGEGRQLCGCANCRRNRKRGVEVQLEVRCFSRDYHGFSQVQASKVGKSPTHLGCDSEGRSKAMQYMMTFDEYVTTPLAEF